MRVSRFGECAAAVSAAVLTAGLAVAWAQNTASTTTTPARRPAAAKPAPKPSAAKPSAVKTSVPPNRPQLGYASREEELWHTRNWAKALFEDGLQMQAAIDAFRKALALAPNSKREKLNLAIALTNGTPAQQGQGTEMLKRIQVQHPELPHPYFILGVQYRKQADFEKAREQFERLIKIAPDDAATRYQLGATYRGLNRLEDAVREFELAVKLNPAIYGPHNQLMALYRRVGRREDAVKSQERFMELKARDDYIVSYLQILNDPKENLDKNDFTEIYDPIDAPAEADRSDKAEIRFEPKTLGQGFEAATGGLLLANLKGDKAPVIVAWSQDRVSVFDRTGAPVPQAALGALSGVRSVIGGDVNNDGAEDLVVITAEGARLLRSEKGVLAPGQLVAQGDFRSGVWVDFDHDYDMDLLLVGRTQKLLRNAGTNGLEDKTELFPFVAGAATDVVMCRTIADTKGFDLIVSYADRPGTLYRDRLMGAYAAEELPVLPAGASGLSVFDFNHDHELDLTFTLAGRGTLLENRRGRFAAAPGDYAAPRRLAFADARNLARVDLVTSAGIALRSAPAEFKGSAVALGQPVAAAVTADLNGDGKQDVVALHSDGSVVLHTNITATTNRYLQVAVEGIKNPVLAVGSEVEVKAGNRYQKQVYYGLPLHFGLRNYAAVETVRITWSNALVQNELRQETNRQMTYKESQRMSGSCPMIFTWNGQRFEFITDVLGVAPLGATAGDGVSFATDHDEYVFLPGTSLANVNGRYSIRISEELGEVSYLDQLQLIAVDSPVGTDVFHNDKWKTPPFPEFRLFGGNQRRYPVAAIDHKGADMLAAVTQKDKRYADGFAHTFQNVAEDHWLELDFGTTPGNDGVLILNGWVDWADGSTFLARSQEKDGGLRPPSLWMQDSDGRWQTVIADMGMPSGKTKTIAVDLKGKWISASRRVRIATNMCVFWDEAFLLDSSAPPPHRMTPLKVAEAELRFHGFSKSFIHPERKQPEHFEYSPVTYTSLWNPTPGRYVRYGDVRDLIHTPDDRYIVMGSGDEVRLEFDAASAPALPQGWKRDFLLKVDGWAKDADANTAFATSVDPLPFHGMKSYPYGKDQAYPNSPAHQRFLKDYLTRRGIRMLGPLQPKRATSSWVELPVSERER